ncbi:MAG TPA: Yip1 family protein, partial [Stellaceae bacterium]|jgi:Yip1 domain|nr:Yip1 family protein [Stellaceae bacterium]
MDIVARVKGILLSPNEEWPVVVTERTNVGALYTGYIMPLAAIPPLAMLIGFSLFLGRFGLGFGLIGAVVSWVLALAGVYIVALVTQWLAPKFGGGGDFIPALKLVTYSHTAGWVGGVFLIIPLLGVITVLMGLYGLYLLYAGSTPVVGVPKERAVTFTVALVVCVIVVYIVIGFIMRLLGLGAMGMMM